VSCDVKLSCVLIYAHNLMSVSLFDYSS